MARAYTVNVVPDGDGGWNVSRAGRTLSRHDTQAKAMQEGRRVARRHRVDLITWGTDGRIRSKDSFGNEGVALDTEH